MAKMCIHAHIILVYFLHHHPYFFSQFCLGFWGFFIDLIIGVSRSEPHTNHHYEKIAVLISVYYNFFSWSDIVSDQASVWSDMIRRTVYTVPTPPPRAGITQTDCCLWVACVRLYS